MSNPKKKTPLQEAIEQLNKLWLKSPKNLAERNYNSGLSEAIVALKSLLQKEKEYTMDAFLAGGDAMQKMKAGEPYTDFVNYFKQYEP